MLSSFLSVFLCSCVFLKLKSCLCCLQNIFVEMDALVIVLSESFTPVFAQGDVVAACHQTIGSQVKAVIFYYNRSLHGISTRQ